mgnify:CR=1 FL=1
MLLSGAGCSESSSTIWNLPAEEVREKLHGQERAFLLGLGSQEIAPEEATRLGPGGVFAVASHLEELGDIETAERFYRSALTGESSPWRVWALLRLSNLLIDRSDYEALRTLLRDEEASRLYPLLAFRFGGALYELDRYRELLDFVRAYRSTPKTDVAVPFSAPELEGEMLIWESVARHQTGDIDGALPAAEELFLSAPLSERQQRLRLYLAYYDLDGRIDPEVATLARGRVALEEGRYREAAELFRGLSPRLFLRETLFDAYRAFRAARYQSAGVEFFRDGLSEGGSSNRFGPELRDRVLYYAGVLALNGGNREEAHNLFREGINVDGSFPPELLWAQFIRSAGYLGTAYLERAVPELIRQARSEPSLRPALEEAVYFLTARSGPTSAEVGETILRRGDSGSAAQVATLSATGVWPVVSPNRADLVAAQKQREELFYRFLAYALLPASERLSPEELLLIDVPERTLSAAATDVSLAATEPRGESALPAPLSQKLYTRLLELGLYEEAYELGVAYGEALSPETLERAAKELQGVGRYYESLRLLFHAGYPEELGSRRRAELFYPRAYDALMVAAAEREGLEPAFWYGVVREESFFSSSVASHAGAVGLSQLMPATAADVARRMGLTGPDLRDPETNIAIGSWYLRSLQERFDRPVAALAAYNAGQGRVSRWLAARPPTMLHFHQRIPYRETRNHVRKVMVSAVYYNYLYYDISPIDTILYFFPGLEELGS